jgi:hypothetical protein
MFLKAYAEGAILALKIDWEVGQEAPTNIQTQLLLYLCWQKSICGTHYKRGFGNITKEDVG